MYMFFYYKYNFISHRLGVWFTMWQNQIFDFIKLHGVELRSPSPLHTVESDTALSANYAFISYRSNNHNAYCNIKSSAER